MGATIEDQERRLRDLQAQAEALELDVDNEGAPSRRRALAGRLSVIASNASRLHYLLAGWKDNDRRVRAVGAFLEALEAASKKLAETSTDAPSGEELGLDLAPVRAVLADRIARAGRRLRHLEADRDRARDAALEVVDPVAAAA